MSAMNTKHTSESAALYVGLTDLNGVWRGKRLPADQMDKLEKGALKMPLSICAIDIWGEDIVGGALLADTGDGDGVCVPTGRMPIAMDWLGDGATFVPLSMRTQEGDPWIMDARQILSQISDKFRAKGLTPVVATELEFYLYDVNAGPGSAPVAPVTKTPLSDDNILSLDDLEQFAPFFADLIAACNAADIPADTATSEAGPGQFEVNFHHVADPVKAADDAVLFKKIARGVARKHGFDANFMAKPYGDRSGNGMHVHFSLLDKDGMNIFDDGTETGSDALRHAVGGLLNAMAAHTLIWAPHANSYRRLTPNAHAPTSICWGYENRTTAIRIPAGPPAARRIEHRVAGADANPYLVLSAILGAALDGIETRNEPPRPADGRTYEQNLPQLEVSWDRSVAAFADDTSGIFPDLMRLVYTQMKRQEINRFLADISDFEYQTYMGTV